MPARHKHTGRLAKRKLAKGKPRAKKLLSLASIVGITLVLLASVFYFFLSTGSSGRISLVAPDKNGNIVYEQYDFKAGTIARVNIPASTQVDVARNLGSWKIGSVVKLGQNEKIGGERLLAETVTKSLTMPVTTFAPSLVERARMAFLKINAKPADIKNIDLGGSTYLIKTKLTDGSLGYKISDGDLPFELRVILADSDISKEGATILLENVTGKEYVSREVSAIVDVMGGKILAITKLDPQNTDCVVFGDGNSVSALAIARVFSCTRQSKLAGYNFDIVVRVGTGFARRY